MPYIKPHRELTIEKSPTTLLFTVGGRQIDVQTHMFKNFHELWISKKTSIVEVTSNGEGVSLKHRSGEIALPNGVTTSLALDYTHEHYDVYLDDQPDRVAGLVIKRL